VRRALRCKSIALVCLFTAALLLAGCERSATPTNPADALQNAWSAFSREDFAQAWRLFQVVADTTPPADRLHDQAVFGMASTCAFRRPDEDLATAEKLFRELIDRHGNDDLGAWSALAIARMYHVRPVGEAVDLDRVAALYKSVVDRFPNTPAADEAFIYNQTIQVTSTEPAVVRMSLAQLQQYIERHPHSPYISAAWELIAADQRVLLRPDDELAAQIRALLTREQDPSNPTLDRAQAYWNIATTAEFDAGNLTIARQYYELFIEQAPTDQKVFPARQALNRLNAVQTQWSSSARVAASLEPSPQLSP